eukprot:2667693-Prymnesium_polylepis.1
MTAAFAALRVGPRDAPGRDRESAARDFRSFTLPGDYDIPVPWSPGHPSTGYGLFGAQTVHALVSRPLR